MQTASTKLAVTDQACGRTMPTSLSLSGLSMQSESLDMVTVIVCNYLK